ncbi:membrane protein [Ktedonospora formicarum]|uniref:Membrane protein n=1 Tax=Ktedonospora formicarum TaxID=2778364 RepID=A0A8J3MNE2_9CHLR|nr:membrane protein [Ktedonospora formicarum]
MLRLLCVCVGLALYALGIVLTFRSGLGLDPWDVLHQGISRHTPLSFGTANIAIGALLIVLCLFFRVYPGVGTVLNMLLIGSLVDLFLRLNVVPDLGDAGLFWRLLVNVAGVGVIGLGTAFYITPRMGAGPRDSLMLYLHQRTKLRLAIVRVSIEVCVLVIGFLLGGTVGFGTLIFAGGIGPAVEGSFYVLRKIGELVRAPQVQPQQERAESGEAMSQLISKK